MSSPPTPGMTSSCSWSLGCLHSLPLYIPDTLAFLIFPPQQLKTLMKALLLADTVPRVHGISSRSLSSRSCMSRGKDEHKLKLLFLNPKIQNGLWKAATKILDLGNNNHPYLLDDANLHQLQSQTTKDTTLYQQLRKMVPGSPVCLFQSGWCFLMYCTD